MVVTGALSCGAKSSPPLRIFTPQTLETALTEATRAFCESETEIRLQAREVITTKLFLWYGKDIGEFMPFPHPLPSHFH